MLYSFGRGLNQKISRFTTDFHSKISISETKGGVGGGGGGGGQTLQHFIKHHTTFVAHCCVLFNLVNRGVAKPMQHFVQHDTTFFRNILNTLNSPSPSRDGTSTFDSSSESILEDCKTSKQAKIKNRKKGQPKTKISRTQLTKFAKKISLGLVNKGMWRKNCFYCQRASTTEYNKVAWAKRVQHQTTSRKTKEMLYRTTFV